VDKELVLTAARNADAAQHYQDGINILTKALKTHPVDPDIVTMLGGILYKVKKYPDAQAVYSRLLRQNEGKMPGQAAIGLGKTLIAQGRFDEADKFLSPITKQLPDNFDVIITQAQIALHRGELDDVHRLLDRASAIAPENRILVHEKGKLALAEKRIDDAIALFEKNVDRAEPYGDSIDSWLECLRENSRELYMRKMLRHYAEKFPERTEFVFGLAITYSRAGEIDNARKAFEQSDKLSPNNFRILYELAVLERLAGDIALSNQLLERVLQLKHDHTAAIRTYGIDHKYTYGDEFFVRLNSVAAGVESLEQMEQIQVHYAQGKAFDDVGELPTAFRHYAIGGLKKRKIDKYVEANSTRMFEIMKKVANTELLPRDDSKGYQEDTATFILGMPRSGTSLMEQILSSHPDIYGAGELKHLTSALENIDISGRRLKLGDIEAAFDYDLNASFEDRGRWYTDMLKSIAGAPYRRIVDKMPGNFNFVGLIHAILPKARIIHSRRHPVETCLSCYRILFAEGHYWTYDLGQLGRYYRRYWDMMQHWRDQYPGVMYEVRYEDNVADVEGQAKKLIDFLGLEWDENCLNFYNTDRPVKTASATQVRKPIYTTSTNRWRKYEKYLGPLLEEIGDLVEQYEAEIAHLK
jgi:tetratricopeptide (TPR) repeat protein